MAAAKTGYNRFLLPSPAWADCLYGVDVELSQARCYWKPRPAWKCGQLHLSSPPFARQRDFNLFAACWPTGWALKNDGVERHPFCHQIPMIAGARLGRSSLGACCKASTAD